MTTLETRDLVRRFGALVVTDDVSLRFESGRRYGVIGPNGAGKTTFFNLLAGALSPSSGSVLFDGRDIGRLDVTDRARLGIRRSFQRNNLIGDMTVLENVVLACCLRDGAGPVFWRPLRGFRRARDEAHAVLERVGLVAEANTPAGQTSYGSQRQLEIGLALAGCPKVLLLDEPTSGMSPEETARMHGLLAELPRDIVVVIIEHDMDILFDIADEIIVLDYGRVLARGTPAEIKASEAVQSRYLGNAELADLAFDSTKGAVS